MTVQITARHDPASPHAQARGLLLIHSCPRAVAPHIVWALTGVFGSRIEPDWQEQPLQPGTLRAELHWQARRGTGARIASALRAFGQVRSEVTEDAANGRLGERFSMTPALGLFRGEIGEHGDVLVPEERLRSALARAGDDVDLADEVNRLLGAPWDAELEPFRCTHAGGVVRVLYEVG